MAEPLTLPGLSEPMQRSASLSEDGRYRWSLHRRWGNGTSATVVKPDSPRKAKKRDKS